MRIIWSNADLNVKDWEDFLQEEHPEVTDEAEKYRLVEELNDLYLDDERANLNYPTEGYILVIAQLGLWDGIHTAYKILDKKNLSEILQEGNCPTMTWYCDGHNIKGVGIHHDGTNRYEYREIREDRLPNLYRLLTKIECNHPVNRKMINYYTKSLAPQVKAIYGW